jgi:hypothetical protein
MTDLSGWFVSVVEAPSAGTPEGFELYAFTSDGLVRLSGGPTLASLVMLPPDRLALGPVTFGGMVVARFPGGRTFVCVDDAGGLEVWHDGQDGHRRAEPTGDDHEAAALLWRLMDPMATRPGARELLARLLLWAWIDRSVAVDCVGLEVAFAELHLRPGIEAFSAGRLRRLGRLLGVTVGDLTTPEDIRLAASVLDHPDLDWTGFAGDEDTDQQLDFLHACIPTRWAMADDLRVNCRRPDLATMVMAAPLA